jgi:hypothetical protein
VRQSLGRGIGTIVASLRLAPGDPTRAAAAVQALDAQLSRLLRRHGVVGVHWLQAAPEVRAQMDRVRVTGRSDASANYVLLIEATRLADVQAVRVDALSTATLEQSGWIEQAFGIYSLMYEVSAKNNETMLGDRV